MIDNSNYIVTGFKKTVLDKFPDKEKMLSDEFTLKLEKLLNALVDKKQSPQWFFWTLAR